MLQIRPVTLVSKPPEKRKKRALPKLVVKETVASKARRYVLKVALSQKVLKNFFVAKINIPNHYPEQKICISCLQF